jgi:hypothetical protein
MGDKCPVCGNITKFMKMAGYSDIQCPRCGNYKFMGDDELNLSNNDITKLSGFLRENQNFRLSENNYKENIASDTEYLISLTSLLAEIKNEINND